MESGHWYVVVCFLLFLVVVFVAVWMGLVRGVIAKVLTECSATEAMRWCLDW